MLLVGLTGGMGVGKSTVARMLGARGAVVFDADELARRAVAKGSPGLRRVVEAFGREVVGADGELDRERMASIVFADPLKRRTLEAITHPEVFRLLQEGIAEHRASDAIVVFDAALLVESGFHALCDVLVVVTAPVEQQVERVMRDRGMGEAAARQRIAAQAPTSEKTKLADLVVVNDGDADDLAGQVDRLWEELERLSADASRPRS